MVYFVWGVTIIFLLLSFKKSSGKTWQALKAGFNTFKKLSPAMLGMIAMLGLVLAIVPKEKLIDLFTYKGPMGLMLVSMVGALLTIPGPIAYPLMGSLLELGASKAILASFIATLTMVGVVSTPLEISLFGRKFTFMRQVLSFLAAIIIGLIMGGIYDHA